MRCKSYQLPLKHEKRVTNNIVGQLFQWIATHDEFKIIF